MCVCKPGTEAYYTNLYLPTRGVIIADANRSPAGLEDPPDVFPDLAHFSDVVWLEWRSQCDSAGVNPNDLNLVLQHQITNEQTRPIIDQVLHNAGARLGD